MDKFIKWCNDLGIVMNDKVVIKKTPNKRYGIYCTANIEKDQPIVVVPNECIYNNIKVFGDIHRLIIDKEKKEKSFNKPFIDTLMTNYEDREFDKYINNKKLTFEQSKDFFKSLVEKEYDHYLKQLNYSNDIISWAYQTFYTYQVEGKLIPFIHLFNTNVDNAELNERIHKNGMDYSVYTSRDYKAGEEITIFYGNYSYEFLFLMYGIKQSKIIGSFIQNEEGDNKE